MYAPHTVTIFNVWEDSNLVVQTNITILRGVFLDTSKADNVTQAGLSSAARAELFIPRNVRAESILGVYKEYSAPKAFAASADKSNLWTLESGGESNSTATYFVKGEVTTVQTLAQLKASYDDVFDVASVALRDFGSPNMHHWMVSGR